MSNMSRADLLRTLSHFDNANSPISKLLANSIGFKFIQSQLPEKTKIEQEEQEELLTEDKETGEIFQHQIKVKNRYWHVSAKEPLFKEEEDKNAISKQLLEVKNLEEKQVKLIHALPLKRAGEWQNLFDISLKQTQKSTKVNISISIKHLSQNRPINNLPKQQRCNFNKPICLILERTQALSVVWEDMRIVWKNIEKLVGKQNLKVYILAAGIEGDFQAAEGTNCSINELEPETRLIYMGTFGGLHTGEMSFEWQHHLREKQIKGHDCQLYSFCPLKNTPVEKVHQLDERSQHANALEQLVKSMKLTWLIYYRQLRYLRESTKGATLHTELLAFNHPDIKKDAQFLWYKHSLFFTDVMDLATIKHNVSEARKRWEHGRSDIAIEMEALLMQMIDQSDTSKLSVPNIDDYPHLKNLAAASQEDHQQGKRRTTSLSLLRSILPELEILATTPAQESWQPLLEIAQTEALYSGMSLPLGEKGLQSTERNYAVIIQQDNHLKLLSVKDKIHPAQKLLTIGNQAYCKEINRVIINSLPLESTINIKDKDFHYQLSSMQKPGWANRIWYNKNGLHAAHQDGTEFNLKPATQAGQSAKWQGAYNAWVWASDYGIDSYGLWAVLSIKSVNFKLRWIPEGSFMMGSLKDEKGRYDDEIQHKVTLTKGFWLAETSVTQAQWQSIMGNYPSKPKDSNLPVYYVSWYHCQSFIEKLKQLVPDFEPQLPSEAQWEYACRAGTKTAYWWGDEFDESKANNLRTLKEESNMYQNKWGLRSMSGNVHEWCNDLNGDYSKKAVTDPTGATISSERVLRGGSWLGDARDLRSAFRNASTPSRRYDDVGLRLAGGFDPQASGNEAMRGTMLTADRRAIAKPVRWQSSLVDESRG